MDMYNKAIEIDPKNAAAFKNKGSNFIFKFFINSVIAL